MDVVPLAFRRWSGSFIESIRGSSHKPRALISRLLMPLAHNRSPRRPGWSRPGVGRGVGPCDYRAGRLVAGEKRPRHRRAMPALIAGRNWRSGRGGAVRTAFEFMEEQQELCSNHQALLTRIFLVRKKPSYLPTSTCDFRCTACFTCCKMIVRP